MEHKNQTNQKFETAITDVIKKVKTKLETALPRTPATGKKLMIALGAIGFSACFSGLVFGNSAFVLGFIFMLCAATGFRLIDNGKIFG